ncbi:MAG: SusC/RagA family TonB-linked outer membrane protein, partial [Prolixibacteraceae bacterium]|nr:SusC/RagA family TonB-linked outer membrane protein [Prolixibacteraceae bacterium]
MKKIEFIFRKWKFPGLQKVLRIMKLTVFLLLLSVISVFASKSYSQTTVLSLDMKNSTVKEVLRNLEKQSEFVFMYSEKLIDVNREVSVTVKNKKINEVLNELFAGTDVSYKVKDRFVLLTTPEVTGSDFMAQQQKSVSGKVTNSGGHPLSGVTVVVKGTTQGTVTNNDGNYTLTNIPEDATLVFSFVGMLTQEVVVGNQTTISVTMEEETIGIEEVVAIGYGTQKKVNLTGSVSAVTSDVLESRPVRNTGQALQGIIPGLNFSQSGTGGDLDEAMDFNIRGAGTIGAGSTDRPLVLIDGIEGDMNALNPQDIDNISVLKDASASSIYGSRAAFGVILITTKTGNKEQLVVNYNNNLNIAQPLHLPETLDSYSFALYWNEGSNNDGGTALFTDKILDRIRKYQAGELDQGTYEYTGTKWEFYLLGNGNTDWIDVHFKDFAVSQEHNVSVSGGTEKSQYYFSGNFLDQNGFIEHYDDNLKRYSTSMNLTTEFSDKVKLNIINRFIRTDYSEPTHQGGLYYFNIYRKYPTIPLYDPNGYLSRASEVPHVQQGGEKNFQTDNYYTQGKLTINPLKGWNIHAEANYRITNRNIGRNVLPTYCYLIDGTPYTEFIALENSYLTAGYTEAYEYNEKIHFFTPSVYSDYEVKINKNHYFKVLAGFNAELYKTRSFSAKKSDLISELFPVLDLATADDLAKGTYGHWSTAGFFARLNYNYKERYLLEINARYDGSSRFLRDQRWNLFPSLSAGWNIANEDFWKFEDISALKLRGSYGELGNQNTSNWYPFYSSQPITPQGGTWLLNGEKPNISSDPNLISKNLTWERIMNWNIGVDIA